MLSPCVDPIPPPPETAPRFCERPLPPYRFAPGRCPHPHRDAAGHHVGVTPEMDDDEAWRYGIDLFNARFYWEAHEAWEAVWRGTHRDSAAYCATKGMIQIAASLLTLYLRRESGARNLAERGAQLLDRARERAPFYRNLDLRAIAELARARLLAPGTLPSLDEAAFVIGPTGETAPPS